MNLVTTEKEPRREDGRCALDSSIQYGEANERLEMGHIEDYFFVAIGLDFFSFQDMRKHLQQTTTVPIQFSDLITYGLIAYIFNDTKWLCVCTLSSLTHNFNRFSNYLDYIQHTLLLQY